MKDMKEKLAKCAFTLFSTHGLKEVSLDMIVQKAGVTKGSFYWHYNSKKEVILAACDYYYTKWFKEAHKLIKKESTALKRLEQVVRMSTRFCIFDKQSRLFSTELFVCAIQDLEIREGWSKFYETVRVFHIQLLEDAAKERKIEIPDPKKNIDLLLAAMEGIKQHALFEPAICSPDHLEENVEMLMQIAIGSNVGSRD